MVLALITYTFGQVYAGVSDKKQDVKQELKASGKLGEEANFEVGGDGLGSNRTQRVRE